MAQNLGKSILTLGVDGSQMTAGLRKAQQDMAKTGKSAKDSRYQPQTYARRRRPVRASIPRYCRPSPDAEPTQ